MSATEKASRRSTTYDPGRRCYAQRAGRQRGRRVYIPAEVLAEAGFEQDEPVYYRVHGYKRSARAGTVLVSLYREP